MHLKLNRTLQLGTVDDKRKGQLTSLPAYLLAINQ